MSRLADLEELRDSSGAFELKLYWPDLSPINRNIWRQTNNPTESAVTGYVPIEMQFDSASSAPGNAGNPADCASRPRISAMGSTDSIQGHKLEPEGRRTSRWQDRTGAPLRRVHEHAVFSEVKCRAMEPSLRIHTEILETS